MIEAAVRLLLVVVDPATFKKLVHPRALDTFPRILGRYVREERLIPLEEAVRQLVCAMSSSTASRCCATGYTRRQARPHRAWPRFRALVQAAELSHNALTPCAVT